METIGLGRALRLINASPSAVLVGTLDEAAFAAAHIPGSLRLDCVDAACLERVRLTLRGERPATPIIVYGDDGQDVEAFRAAHLLENDGHAPVCVLEDGLAGWIAAGYRIASFGRDEQLQLDFTTNERLHHGDWPQ